LAKKYYSENQNLDTRSTNLVSIQHENTRLRCICSSGNNRIYCHHFIFIPNFRAFSPLEFL